LFPKNFAILVGAYVLWKRVPCGGSSMWEGTLTELSKQSRQCAIRWRCWS